MIDFDGPTVADLPESARTEIDVVVTPARGRIVKPYSHRLVGTKRWRGIFEIELADRDPVDVRAYLRMNGKPLTETWIGQIIPPE